ncbi:MAG: hypothetical protein IKR18_11725 [Bacteroidaceae bacterium]|nr:hypothetical protein [Bacteroidaceae bacterium]
MNTDVRRQHISRLLLAVYLTILSASFFHVHEHGSAEPVCQDCLSHVHHDGHLSAATMSVGECLICSFLSTTYLSVQAIALPFVLFVLFRQTLADSGEAVSRVCALPLLRAPPVAF